jgi:hypothetical protein
MTPRDPLFDLDVCEAYRAPQVGALFELQNAERELWFTRFGRRLVAAASLSARTRRGRTSVIIYIDQFANEMGRFADILLE